MKRGAVIGIAAATAGVLVAGGVVAWLLTRPPSAEAVAEQLRALSAGDASAVKELVSDDEDLDSIDAAFSGATGYISDYSFTLKREADAARTVRADVELAGEPAVVGFVLTQQGGRWKVGSDYLASLEVDTTLGDSVRVGGVLFATSGPIALLPAEYSVAAAPAGLVDGNATAVATNEVPVTLTLDATLAPAATERAQEQLDAYADSCAKPAAAVPANCGLRVPWAADLAALSSLAFRIDAYPTVAISDDGRTFNAIDGHIVATATGTPREGGTGSFTYRADDWALRGTVAFTGDEMVLAVR